MPTLSLLMQTMEVIQVKIRALNLTDIPDVNVLIHQVPRDLEKDLPATTPFPCVIIAPIGSETLDPMGGPNNAHDVGYPIQIVFLDQGNQDQTANYDRNLFWREQVIDKLHHCQMGLTYVRNIVIQPGTIIDPGGWTKGKFLSGLRALVTARKARIP